MAKPDLSGPCKGCFVLPYMAPLYVFPYMAAYRGYGIPHLVWLLIHPPPVQG